MNTREFLDDMRALLKKHGVKSITPLCCIDCDKGEWHHIKILDDGRLSLCGMKIDAIDMVEVVRCKDCKYFTKDTYMDYEIGLCSQGVYHCRVDDNHYCSHGKRKEQNK